MTPDGHHYLLQPVPAKHKHRVRRDTHLLYKRSSPINALGTLAEESMAKTCLFDAKDDPLPVDQDEILLRNRRNHRLAVMKVGWREICRRN